MESSAEAAHSRQERPVRLGNGNLKPLLKWAGGKRWLIPHLYPIWQEYQQLRLVEPFCGGLAVALGLRPNTALLNDANPHLVNFYRQIKHGFTEQVLRGLSERTFYERRSRFNQLIDQRKQNSVEAAALFYYLNRTCYNGLCRFNKAGKFNVPYGKRKKVNFETEFADYGEMFSGWIFSCKDFERLEVATGDFIYADPPYDVQFRQYAKHGFPWADQVRLAKWLSLQRGPVVLSNQATPRILELYEGLGFKTRLFDAPRMISCNGDRTRATEVLATRNICLQN
jgi:DNA adenine methylase